MRLATSSLGGLSMVLFWTVVKLNEVDRIFDNSLSMVLFWTVVKLGDILQRVQGCLSMVLFWTVVKRQNDKG